MCRVMKTIQSASSSSGFISASNIQPRSDTNTMKSISSQYRCSARQYRLSVSRLDQLWIVHNNDVIMSAIASQITSLTIFYSTVYLGADQRWHQSSASLDFVWGIHRWPVNSPHKGPVTWKMSPFGDVIMVLYDACHYRHCAFFLSFACIHLLIPTPLHFWITLWCINILARSIFCCELLISVVNVWDGGYRSEKYHLKDRFGIYDH